MKLPELTVFTPVTVRLAMSCIERDVDRRTAIAMRDERLVHLERSSGGHLSLDDWHALQSALDSVPTRPWIPLCAWIARGPQHRAATAVRHGAQRMRRGWDDTAMWSLDEHLCATLAQQLDALAESTDGWPDSVFDTFLEWQQALRDAACALAGYKARTSGPAFLHWDAVLADPAASSEDRHDAMEAALAEERAATAAAQGALRWVADMLPHLWN